jgi:hypothetical protein
MVITIQRQAFKVNPSTDGLTPSQAKTLDFLVSIVEPTPIKTALEYLGLSSVLPLESRIAHLIEKGKLTPVA